MKYLHLKIRLIECMIYKGDIKILDIRLPQKLKIKLMQKYGFYDSVSDFNSCMFML